MGVGIARAKGRNEGGKGGQWDQDACYEIHKISIKCLKIPKLLEVCLKDYAFHMRSPKDTGSTFWQHNKLSYLCLEEFCLITWLLFLF